MGTDAAQSELQDGDEAAASLALERLVGAQLSGREQDLVLSAVLGEAALAACLDGEESLRIDATSPDVVAPPAAFLSGIAVEGLRGIGAKAQLGLSPGPGLTLIVGRNGTGKSSFAEAAELSLTGTCSRWADKKVKVWQEGWSNLHHEGERIAEVRLSLEGKKGEVSIVRRWPPSAGLGEAESYAQRLGEKRQAVASLGFDPALSTWRPFLSYSELGGLLEEGPSRLYDAISRILGLNEWVQAEARLNRRRKELESRAKDVKAEAANLRQQLGEIADERAQAVLEAMPLRDPSDLDLIENVVGGVSTPPNVVALEALANLEVGDVATASDRSNAIRVALAEVDATAKTDTGRAKDLVVLLNQALKVHEHAGDAVCPVCFTSGAIDSAWENRTRTKVVELEEEARVANTASRALSAAVGQARTLLVPTPVALKTQTQDIDTHEAARLWDEWFDAPDSPFALAEHIDSRYDSLQKAVAALKLAAAEEIGRRRDTWQPVAARVQSWVQEARQVQVEAPLVGQLKSAAKWLASEATRVRDERFAPIAKQVMATYAELCPSSNVSLDDVSLGGTNTRRHVNLSVSVDEIAGQAIAVMSQGELHALTLSLFLPRATLPQSPFRFIVIDDPVQAMDGSRVDGLAQVLSQVAKERQVVVFTHDERLSEATRRLRLPAKVLEVSRGRRSTVSIRRRRHPVDDYIDDARAVINTQDYPEEVRRRVIPGLCRNAVEAACSEAAFRRLLEAGVTHEEARAQLAAAHTLLERLSLAIWGAKDRAGDVLGEMNRSLGRLAGDCVRSLKEGTHEMVGEDPRNLIDEADAVAHHVLSL